jgi:hypothetical protein
LTSHNFAVFKQQYGWNISDAIFGGKFLIGINIDFPNNGFAGIL